MIKDNSLIYKIGISLIPGIGPITAKKLIAYCGSPEGVFTESRKRLEKIPDIGSHLSTKITDKSVLEKAEKEIKFIENYNLTTFFYLDKDYPERLRHCNDAPVMLFQKGNCDLNKPKIVSIVGTRNATQRGRDTCNKFVAELSENHPDLIVVSGLAYGIDIAAHKAALKNNLDTITVLGHGLSTIYPPVHRSIAKEIVEHGSLLTEFLSYELPEKPNFVKRNRIIAGLADATVVIESGKKGGALITADIANSYNRDVFAFPGRVSDTWSKGCNWLILTNKAALIEGVSNLEYIMGWNADKKNKEVIQTELFHELDEDDTTVSNILKESGDLTIDQISIMANSPVSKISSVLLNLEFKGIVKCLPGRVYKINF